MKINYGVKYTLRLKIHIVNAYKLHECIGQHTSIAIAACFAPIHRCMKR